MNNKYNKNEPIPVLVLSEKLCTHTLRVTQNLNNFPKKYRFTLVDKLVSCTLEICDYIQDANMFRGDERIYYQTKAISNCRKMKLYLRLVYEVIKPECSITFWDSIVDELEEQLSKWKKSTKK